MLNVKDTFSQGPKAVTELFANLRQDGSVDDMDAKVLADHCWTRASTLAKSHVQDAREWGRAALAGYEFLSRFGKPAVARSAAENAESLRAWRLLQNEAPQPLNQILRARDLRQNH